MLADTLRDVTYFFVTGFVSSQPRHRILDAQVPLFANIIDRIQMTRPRHTSIWKKRQPGQKEQEAISDFGQNPVHCLPSTGQQTIRVVFAVTSASGSPVLEP